MRVEEIEEESLETGYHTVVYLKELLENCFNNFSESLITF